MEHYAGSLCPDDDGLGTQLSLIDDDDANAQGAVHISTEQGPRDSICGLRVLPRGCPCPNAGAFSAEPFLSILTGPVPTPCVRALAALGLDRGL
jgi:hypothetical protein